jgi:uncharacterized protein YcfJ
MTTGLVGQNQIAPFTSPIPGGSLDATVVLGNDNSTVTSYDAHDNDSTIHFQSSALADRPPASTAGQKWLTTDAAARYIYYDTGSAWVEVNYFRDSGGIITGAVTISDTTQSTSTTTGALIVSGGVGIAKNVFIGGTLGVTGVATFTAQPIVSTLTASKPVFTDASKGLVSTGTLGTDQGGTNLTTYTTGDILYASATNVLSKLAIGTTGQHLIVTAGLPAWGTDTALGTVTSVSWTGGLVSVATATTTPAFTVAGTSGGIVYFSSASTWASSAALTQYGVVYGGGAGATPVATAAGTTGQVLTATTSGAPTWSATYAGTVTSVGFTGGLISVATATTTPALTVAGTSGGVVYFSSASTWASSAALTASALVLGGGAGAAPATTTTGTGVVTALGVNVGTAGAFVVNGGALGTPSSGAVAASLITAGTFGAGAYTFPGALAITGAFTGATTGAFSGTVSTGALTATTGADRTVLIAQNSDSSTYNVISLSGSASNTGHLGFMGGATGNNSLYIDVPTGGAFNFRVNVTNVASISTTGALAITGAFTGATTGAFSGAVSTGALTSTTGRFSGEIGMGGAPYAGIGVYLQSTFALSGVNQYGIVLEPKGTSASTGSLTGLQVGLQTTAASYTTTAARGVYISDVTIGAGSAITTLYGLLIGDQVGGGTNYAIYTGAGLVRFGGAATFSSTVQIGTVSTLSQYGNSIYASRNFEFNLTYSAAVVNNKDIGFSYVDNTHLRVYMKGSDGVTRSVDLTVA